MPRTPTLPRLELVDPTLAVPSRDVTATRTSAMPVDASPTKLERTINALPMLPELFPWPIPEVLNREDLSFSSMSITIPFWIGLIKVPRVRIPCLQR